MSERNWPKFKTVCNPKRYEVKDGQWVEVSMKQVRDQCSNPDWYTPAKGTLIGFTLTAVT